MGNAARIAGDDRFALNKTDQAEMKRRVAEGEAQEKSAEAPKKPRARKAAAKPAADANVQEN